MTGSHRSVLVVGPAWIGDMVMAQALFASIADGGRVSVDVVAPPVPLALTERMPEVREAFPLPVDHGRLGLRARLTVGQTLRERGYDQAVIVPSSFKSALVPWMARIPRRTGYRGESRIGLINDVRKPRAYDTERNVRGYLGLVSDEAPPPGTHPRLAIDAHNQRALIQRLELDQKVPVVALAPGAAHGPAKRWPAKHFRRIAERLSANGYAVWIVGGPEERELADEIGSGLGRTVLNLCGRTSLTEAVDLLNLAQVTVSNDSGLMHVAAAVGSHVVAVYGPTTPAFAPPLTDARDIIYLDVDCSPCFARTCPLVHHRCLQTVDPDAVYAKVVRAIRTS